MTPVSLSSVIIEEEKIEEIKAAISQIEHTHLIFTVWGFSEVFEKGTGISLLFYGIPGTGKTLMAEAISDNLGYILRMITAAEIETSEPGGAERNIKAVFSGGKTSVERGGSAASGPGMGMGMPTPPGDPTTTTTPTTNGPQDLKKTIICFDECDSLIADRNSIGNILASQVNVLLSELERFEGVTIFTTNRLGRLDPALERRITAKIEFSFPNEKQRSAIWRRMIPKRAPLAEDVDMKKLASYPMVGGNIKNAVLNAARKAAYRKLRKINMRCFVEAVESEVKALEEFLEEAGSTGTVRQGIQSEMKREVGKIAVHRPDVVTKSKGKDMVITAKTEFDKEKKKSEVKKGKK